MSEDDIKVAGKELCRLWGVSYAEPYVERAELWIRQKLEKPNDKINIALADDAIEYAIQAKKELG